MLDRARGAQAPRSQARRERPAPTPPETPVETRPTPRTTSDSGDTGLYVYCVVGADAEVPADLDGIADGHAPKTIRHRDLAAVVSDVPLEDFTEERLREHLSDMDWIEHTARTHEQVLEAIADRATLIPMRLCSVYGNERGVLEMLMREAPALTEALEHLEGKAEWGVKVFAAAREAGRRGPSAADSGTDYMRQRQGERDARAQAGQHQHEACVDIHERIAEIVADAQSIPVQRPEVSGHDGQMVLNGVYLVEDDQREAFS